MGQLWEKRKKQWQSWWLCFAALQLLKRITQYKAASKLDLLPVGVCAEHQNQSMFQFHSTGRRSVVVGMHICTINETKLP